jgi:hypothetical protein
MQSSEEAFALFQAFSPLHTREKKSFTYRARTAVAPKLYPGYAVSCKYSQTALQQAQPRVRVMESSGL